MTGQRPDEIGVIGGQLLAQALADIGTTLRAWTTPAPKQRGSITITPR